MNFQNIPRDDKVVKRCIVPKLGALSFFDYKQIEPRLTAFYAAKVGFPEFAEQIRAGVDCYTAVAKLVTNQDEVSDEERQTWKRVYLSLLYGGGTTTILSQIAVSDYLAKEFGTTKAAARGVIDQFHRNWPAVRHLQDMCQAVERRKGYITSIGGRQLHLEQYGEHKLLNKLIQGGAADVMKEGLIRIHRHLRANPEVESHLVSVVHDEAQLDGPEREVPYLHNAIPNLMDCFPEVSEIVPIEVDHEVATTSWADKVEYEEWAAMKEAA